MPRIALLSDTHSHLDESIFNYFDECDEIWHAGDFGSLEVVEKLRACKPLKGVFGNIDGVPIRAGFPEDLMIDAGGMKVFITHIAGPPGGKYTPRVRKILLDKKPDVLICGHSHILKVMRDPAFNIMYINPGAAGNEGFHKLKTFIRFTIKGRSLSDLEVVELGKRGALNQHLHL